ncbi:MAG TPA: DUF4097 family beta strand repeat-containing protein [bacterium]|nr:DUF4097 family beta strand repeat-containing protein [bacterium]
MHKRWIVTILFVTGIICYIFAFSLFFDSDKAKTAIKNSSAGPVLSEINNAIKDGFKAPSGCKPSDFAGNLGKISLFAISADIVVKGSNDSLPSVNFMDSVSCARNGTELSIKIPAFSAVSFSKRSNGRDVSMSGKVTDEIILFIPETPRYDIELKSISGDIEAKNISPATLYADTKSGDIELDGIKGSAEINANSVSGDVEIEVGSEAKATAESVSGDIRIDLPETAAPVTLIKAKTVSGDIRIDSIQVQGGI